MPARKTTPVSPPREVEAAPVSPSLPPEPPPVPSGPIASLPGPVQAAAVLLLIFGTLSGIGTAFVVVMTLTFAAIPWDPMMWDPALGGVGPCYGVMGLYGSNSCDMGYGLWMGVAAGIVMGAIGALVTAGHLASGVAILRRRAWGRILGLVVSGVAVVVLVLALGTVLIGLLVPMPPFEAIPGFDDPYFDPATERYLASITAAGSAFGAVVIGFTTAAYAYILWVLARRGDAFD